MSDAVVGSISNAATPATQRVRVESDDGLRSTKMAKLVASRVYGQAPGHAGSATRLAADSVTDVFESIQTERKPTQAAHSSRTSHGKGSLPFYQNPAQQVEVATVIAVGRTLDVKG